MSQLWMDAQEGKEDSEGNEDFYFQQRAFSAATSCERIAQSEEILGYQESADAYRDMAREIKEAGTWRVQDRTDKLRYYGGYVPPYVTGTAVARGIR